MHVNDSFFKIGNHLTDFLFLSWEHMINNFKTFTFYEQITCLTKTREKNKQKQEEEWSRKGTKNLKPWLQEWCNDEFWHLCDDWMRMINDIFYHIFISNFLLTKYFAYDIEFSLGFVAWTKEELIGWYVWASRWWQIFMWTVTVLNWFGHNFFLSSITIHSFALMLSDIDVSECVCYPCVVLSLPDTSLSIFFFSSDVTYVWCLQTNETESMRPCLLSLRNI